MKVSPLFRRATAGFPVLCLLVAGSLSGAERLDVNAMLASGAVHAEHTVFDIGTIENAFDGNTSSIVRTPNLDPLVITLTFDAEQRFAGFRSWFLGGPNRWKVEAADTAADLDAGVGSYALLVDWTTESDNTWSAVSLDSPHAARVVRYTQNRLTGDDYVHLGEWELLAAETEFAVVDIRAGESGIDVVWNSRVGQWYAVERSGDLADWTPVDYRKGSATTETWTDGTVPGEAGLFYRIHEIEPEDRPFVVKKVLVLNYDPILESKGGRRVHEYFGWNDPRALTDGYLGDLNEASGNYVRWEIVEFLDIDEFPLKADGFRYTDQSYLDAWATGTFHSPDGVDYVRIIEDHDLDARVRAGEIDEVVVWGAPYFGYYESRMVGSTAYWCNSPGLYRPNTPLYVMMGLNYERGVAEAIHSFGHRAESILRHVYGSWSGGSTVNHLWDRFTRYEKIAPGLAACGNVHFPPNGQSDYDYGNSTLVWSEADDWLDYPNFTGAGRWINASEWGWSQRGYLKWWYRHMPKVPGRYSDGKLNNWWAYLVDMNEYAESR